MKKKGLVIVAIVAVLTASSALSTLAGTWTEDTGKWYYLDDTGKKA